MLTIRKGHTYSPTLKLSAIVYVARTQGYRSGLEEAQQENEALAEVSIQLPNFVFEAGFLNLHLGDKTVELYHMPGHSMDMINIFVREQRILFASDNMMPVPTIFDGQLHALRQSLEQISALQPDSIVRGHGEIVLRGEVERTIRLPT